MGLQITDQLEAAPEETASMPKLLRVSTASLSGASDSDGEGANEMAVGPEQHFASHCYAFYRDTTSLDGEEGSFRSKMVVQAFEQICQGVVLTEKSAPLKKCGLVDNPSLDIARYANIQREQRCKVHREQMKERQELFMSRLKERLEIAQNPTASVTTFCQKYYTRKDIGTHSLLAGIRRVLEKQMQDNSDCDEIPSGADGQQLRQQYCLSWTLDVCTITENCIASQGDDFIVDAIDMLCALFDSNAVLADTEDRRANEDGSKLLFTVKSQLTNSQIQQALGKLPKSCYLEARSSGDISVSTIARRCSVEDCQPWNGDRQFECHHVLDFLCSMWQTLLNRVGQWFASK